MDKLDSSLNEFQSKVNLVFTEFKKLTAEEKKRAFCFVQNLHVNCWNCMPITFNKVKNNRRRTVRAPTVLKKSCNDVDSSKQNDAELCPSKKPDTITIKNLEKTNPSQVSKVAVLPRDGASLNTITSMANSSNMNSSKVCNAQEQVSLPKNVLKNSADFTALNVCKNLGLDKNNESTKSGIVPEKPNAGLNNEHRVQEQTLASVIQMANKQFCTKLNEKAESPSKKFIIKDSVSLNIPVTPSVGQILGFKNTVDGIKIADPKKLPNGLQSESCFPQSFNNQSDNNADGNTKDIMQTPAVFVCSDLQVPVVSKSTGSTSDPFPKVAEMGNRRIILYCKMPPNSIAPFSISWPKDRLKLPTKSPTTSNKTTAPKTLNKNINSHNKLSMGKKGNPIPAKRVQNIKSIKVIKNNSLKNSKLPENTTVNIQSNEHFISIHDENTGHVVSCVFCRKGFPSMEDIKSHTCYVSVKERVEQDKKTQVYECLLCKITFLRLSHLQKHLSCHSRNFCKICNHNFTGQNVLCDHLKVAGMPVDRKVFTCPFCQKHFLKHTTFSNHLKEHPYGKFACNECGEVFEKQEQFSKHKETRCRKVYTCKFCNKTYVRKSTYDLHIKRHKRYFCSSCNVSFAIKKLWEKHQSSVHGKKNELRGKKNELRNHVCSVCKKSFQRPMHLKLHERMHMGEKPWSCNHCKKNFSDKKTFDTHIKTAIHVKRVSPENKVDIEKKFSCDKCGAKFYYQPSLSRHVEQIHGNAKLTKCPHCEYRSKYDHNMKRHIEFHNDIKHFMCEMCGVVFKTLPVLHDHQLYIHSEKRLFVCDICSEKFKSQSDLQRHMRKHSDSRPYTCPCNQSYKRICHLRRHMLTAHKIAYKPNKVQKITNEIQSNVTNAPSGIKSNSIQSTNIEAQQKLVSSTNNNCFSTEKLENDFDTSFSDLFPVTASETQEQMTLPDISITETPVTLYVTPPINVSSTVNNSLSCDNVDINFVQNSVTSTDIPNSEISSADMQNLFSQSLSSILPDISIDAVDTFQSLLSDQFSNQKTSEASNIFSSYSTSQTSKQNVINLFDVQPLDDKVDLDLTKSLLSETDCLLSTQPFTMNNHNALVMSDDQLLNSLSRTNTSSVWMSEEMGKKVNDSLLGIDTSLLPCTPLPTDYTADLFSNDSFVESIVESFENDELNSFSSNAFMKHLLIS